MEPARSLPRSHEPTTCAYSELSYFPLPRQFQRIRRSLRPCATFCNVLVFRMRKLAPRPAPASGSSIVGCPRLLINTFSAILHIYKPCSSSAGRGDRSANRTKEVQRLRFAKSRLPVVIFQIKITSYSYFKIGRDSSPYSDSLRDGRSGDRVAVRARFFAPVQTSPGAHPAPCTMVTESLSRG